MIRKTVTGCLYSGSGGLQDKEWGEMYSARHVIDEGRLLALAQPQLVYINFHPDGCWQVGGWGRMSGGIINNITPLSWS